MEWFWIILGLVLILVGLAGSILPVLPGPPLAYAGLLMQQFREPDPFTTRFLVVWGIITAVIVVLDYLVPIWGTKRYGGTKYGIWGCTLGFLLAFWMGPVGIIAGPFVGAFIGEMIAQQNSKVALRAAWGSVVGFLLGTVIKLVACVMMLYNLIMSVNWSQ